MRANTAPVNPTTPHTTPDRDTDGIDRATLPATPTNTGTPTYRHPPHRLDHSTVALAHHYHDARTSTATGCA